MAGGSCEMTKRSDHFKVWHHHGQGFAFSMFPLAESCDCGLGTCIHHQMKSTDATDSNN